MCLFMHSPGLAADSTAISWELFLSQHPGYPTPGMFVRYRIDALMKNRQMACPFGLIHRSELCPSWAKHCGSLGYQGNPDLSSHREGGPRFHSLMSEHLCALTAHVTFAYMALTSPIVGEWERF